MQSPERSVLNVLPHPGGGGETYVDLLSTMPGYISSRVYLAPSAAPAYRELPRGVAHAYRSARGHDLLHVHGEVASGLCLPLLAALPSVVTLNGLHLVRRLHGLARAVAALNLRGLVWAADRTICVAGAERDYLLEAIGQSRGCTVVVHNGVLIPPPPQVSQRTAARRELRISEAEPVAIWVGSLDDRKDPHAALRAAKRAAVTLLLVGDGPLRATLEREGGAHVRVLGHRSDVPRLLDAADVFVLTSRREGFAFSLLEAMAHQLAPVVADVPENVEAIGDSGLVFDNEDGLVAALRRLVESPVERAALGERARRRVAELFDATEMARRTRAVYDDVLAGRGLGGKLT
jgi:glycosyltransferase involved in cell wall biosynthesis